MEYIKQLADITKTDYGVETTSTSPPNITTTYFGNAVNVNYICCVCYTGW
jgi:hypothetical protein